MGMVIPAQSHATSCAMVLVSSVSLYRQIIDAVFSLVGRIKVSCLSIAYVKIICVEETGGIV